MADKFLKTLKLPGIDQPYKIPQTAEDVGARPADWIPTSEQVGARPDTWMPNATDVGARPDTWMPTALDVGARADDWLPTLAEIGAAPSGYGYGGTAISLKNSRVETDAELETLLQSVYGAMSATTTKLVYWSGYPSATSHGWFGILSKSSDNNGGIKAWSANLAGSLIFKVKFSGTWQPLEWQNPPMALGEEYRTTERYNGKAVYAKYLDLGTLPSSGNKSTSYCAVGGGEVVRWEAYAISGSGSVNTFPFFTTNGEMRAKIYFTEYSVVVTAITDSSGNTGKAIVWYTKD